MRSEQRPRPCDAVGPGPRRPPRPWWTLALIALLVVGACGGDDEQAVDAASDASSGEVEDDADGGSDAETPDDVMPYERLSTYGFFSGALADQTPAAGVIAYDVRASLYADETEKLRFIVLPEGATIDFDARERWGFPVGTTLIKTFLYPLDARDPSAGRRLLETRLLTRTAETWEVQIYRWREDQSEADRFIAGDEVQVERINAAGEAVVNDYIIPDKNQCKNCHEQSRQMVALGPRTWQLNGVFDHGDGPQNQLERLAALGVFSAPLPAAPEAMVALVDLRDEGAEPTARARAYLEANCAHCHNPAGSASSSGLNLGFEVERAIDLGVCRPPFAAGPGSGGLRYDIVPGDPDASIMIHRMRSTDPEVKMPELPTRTVDVRGVEIISAWIRQLEGSCE